MPEDKDIREEILNNEYGAWVEQRGIASIYPNSFPQAYKEAAINAMDERGKQMSEAFGEYIFKNVKEYWYENTEDYQGWLCQAADGEVYTLQQLFSNFL